ncbi:MAG: hypothetical protein V2A54_02445, partial [Bacteroidota bacterium]
MQRNGKQSLPNMDNLAYNYYSGTNKLAWVDDDPSYSGNYGEDIDDQSSGNYKYDAIGQLYYDYIEEIDSVVWNLYGKVSKIIRRAGSTKPQVEYEYNANGDLIEGIEKPYNHLNDDIYWTKIFYSNDAMGNVMAEYTRKEYTGGEEQDVITLSNFPIYGSSRLGVLNVDKTIDVLKAGMNDTVKRYCGVKMYQMENHLGDVYAVVSDIRVSTGGTASGESTLIKYFKAEVKSINDYYPYGSLKPARGSNPDDYEYGMNGQRKLDKAVTGKTGGLYIAKYWIYNSQTGVRWNRDPKPMTGISDYACFGGNPIMFNDILGDKIKGDTKEDATKTKNEMGTSIDNADPGQGGKGQAFVDKFFTVDENNYVVYNGAKNDEIQAYFKENGFTDKQKAIVAGYIYLAKTEAIVNISFDDHSRSGVDASTLEQNKVTINIGSPAGKNYKDFSGAQRPLTKNQIFVHELLGEAFVYCLFPNHMVDFWNWKNENFESATATLKNNFMRQSVLHVIQAENLVLQNLRVGIEDHEIQLNSADKSKVGSIPDLLKRYSSNINAERSKLFIFPPTWPI